MRYEIYIDTLFLMNFGMNIYLLELTDYILKHATTWRRVLLGALCGSICMTVPWFLGMQTVMAKGIGFAASVVIMPIVTFKIKGVMSWLHVVEILALVTVVIGSVLHYILFTLAGGMQKSLLWMLILGAACFLMLRRILLRSECKNECKVTLKNHKVRIVVDALLDTGNGLIEPISGASVAVLDKKVFELLFSQSSPEGFRVIPYRSVDKKCGVMPGYLIPEMIVEWNGCCRVFQNIYAGIAPECMEGTEKYKMILNPNMLKERKTE